MDVDGEDVYTVNHKKRDILFLSITLWRILTDFYSFIWF